MAFWINVDQRAQTKVHKVFRGSNLGLMILSKHSARADRGLHATSCQSDSDVPRPKDLVKQIQPREVWILTFHTVNRTIYSWPATEDKNVDDHFADWFEELAAWCGLLDTCANDSVIVILAFLMPVGNTTDACIPMASIVVKNWDCLFYSSSGCHWTSCHLLSKKASGPAGWRKVAFMGYT